MTPLPTMVFPDKERRNRGSYYKYHALLTDGIVDEVDSVEQADLAFMPMEHPKGLARSAKPYLLNLNDVSSFRHFAQMMPRERYRVSDAAAIVTPSRQLLDKVLEQVKYPEERIAVIPLKPLLRDVTFTPLPKTKNPSIVYAGGFQIGQYGYGIRDYRGVFKDIIDEGIEVHMYAPLTADIEKAIDLGVHYHGLVPQHHLYKEMSQYHAGLIAYMQDFGYSKLCNPNKTWEYLAAGIPTIGWMHVDNPSSIFVQGGWGITKTQEETWAEALERSAAETTITDELRQRETIDSEKGKLAKLIDSIA